MTAVEVFALATVAALLKNFATTLVQGAVRFRSKRFARPEDAQWLGGDPQGDDHPVALTAQLALRNDLENIPLFLFLLLGYALLQGDASRAGIHAIVFFVARTLHTVAYLYRVQPWRNVCYQFGFVATLSMCGHVMWQVARA